MVGRRILLDRRKSDGLRWGFTLVELIIVVAVLAIIIAVALPSLLNARMSANEANAISAMRTLSTVNEQYRIRYARFASSFNDLTSAGYIDSRLASGTKSGYTYNYAAGGNTFTVTAAPQDPGQSGIRSFFTNDSGVLRFATTGTATVASPPLDG